MVKKSPAKAGDTGSTSDLEITHRPHASERLSPCATAVERVLRSPGATAGEARSPQGVCSATRDATTMRSPRSTAGAAPAPCN